MKKEDKIKFLEETVVSLEKKLIMCDIDKRLWAAETMGKANQANLQVSQQARAQYEITEKQLKKAKEILDELKK